MIRYPRRFEPEGVIRVIVPDLERLVRRPEQIPKVDP